jgi:phosphatidylglycerol:prolipoprotein diacylglycerol transferase
VPFIIDIDPVALRVAGIDIRWYGVTLAIAIGVAYAVASSEARRHRLALGVVADGAVWVGIAALAGGRALYLVQDGLPDLAAHPAHIFMVWMGGLSFYGGLLAGLVALIVFARRRGISWLVALDVAAPAAAIGQAIGHVGCLIGGDSSGIATSVPWAVIYENRGAMAPLGVPLHPTQAYEALALTALFAVLWWMRTRLTVFPGALAAVYLGGLAAIRFLLFFLRDEPAVFAGLKTAQLIGLAILGIAAALLMFALRRPRRRRTHALDLEVAQS